MTDRDRILATLSEFQARMKEEEQAYLPTWEAAKKAKDDLDAIKKNWEIASQRMGDIRNQIQGSPYESQRQVMPLMPAIWREALAYCHEHRNKDFDHERRLVYDRAEGALNALIMQPGDLQPSILKIRNEIGNGLAELERARAVAASPVQPGLRKRKPLTLGERESLAAVEAGFHVDAGIDAELVP